MAQVLYGINIVYVYLQIYTQYIYIYSITIITIIQYWLLGDVMYLL